MGGKPTEAPKDIPVAHQREGASTPTTSHSPGSPRGVLAPDRRPLKAATVDGGGHMACPATERPDVKRHARRGVVKRGNHKGG